MKKMIIRKHGHAARVLSTLEDISAAPQPKPRLKTLLTFQTSSQCYLWTTDRGRSRLIKH